MKKFIAVGVLAGSLALAQGMPPMPTLGQATKAVTASGTGVVDAGATLGAAALEQGKTLGTAALEQGKTAGKEKLGELADKAEARGGELTDKATAKVNVPVASPVANALARQGMKTGVGAAKSKVGIKPAPAPTK